MPLGSAEKYICIHSKRWGNRPARTIWHSLSFGVVHGGKFVKGKHRRNSDHKLRLKGCLLPDSALQIKCCENTQTAGAGKLFINKNWNLFIAKKCDSGSGYQFLTIDDWSVYMYKWPPQSRANVSHDIQPAVDTELNPFENTAGDERNPYMVLRPLYARA